jgi:hypothetical protein
MKALAILALSILIIIASLCFVAFCLCAAGASVAEPPTAGERALYAIAAVVALVSIIGMVKLIGKLDRSKGL